MNPRVLKLAAVSLMFLLASCQTAKVSQEEMDAVNYGPQPTHWKEEIQSYLKALRDGY